MLTQQDLDIFVAEASAHIAYIRSCLRQLEQRQDRGLDSTELLHRVTARVQELDGVVSALAGPVPQAPESTVTYTGTTCSVPGCMALQFQTPSGLTCEYGHGGVEPGGLVVPQVRGIVRKAPAPTLQRPDPLFLVEGATPPPHRHS